MRTRRRWTCSIVSKFARAVPFHVVFIGVSMLLAAGQTTVTTYHYDNYRTGWNQNESQLTPAQVGSASFELLQNVALDGQVDAQPLVVPGVVITAGPYQGAHDVVYVATENNTVFAIDVHTGSVLLNPNFGPPTGYPLGCNSSGANAGITSTPVIDLTSNTLYAMVYTSSSGNPTFMLHALDLGNLTDKVTPQVVSASHILTDGSTVDFNAMYERQRPALLLANGGIYAAFGSFCDLVGDYISRGWLLGWTAGSLTPFPSSQLTNQLATDANGYYLSSIWMSGYGPAVDDEGNILFVTGNSDYSGTTYNDMTNIEESVVKVSPALDSMLDIFTPDNQSSLDQGDSDFGSGGVLVLPDQPGTIPHMATAAGKDGNMYFMNEDNLGGYSPMQNNVLGTYQVGGCWCGESYYVDPTDGLGRVVSSGGNTVEVWKVQTSPTAALTNVTKVGISSGTWGPGSFTSISSNGTANPIIWALSRPAWNSNGVPISLYAFNPESGGGTMTQLFQAAAGAWPNTRAFANPVPVVANGLVFVASYKQLQIFGLAGSVVATTTALSSSLNPSVSGGSVLFTATVSAQSGGGIPTGTVTFYNGTTAMATLSLTNSGSAQYSTTALPLGSNSITAVYGGSASYSGSTSSPLNQVVQTVPPTATTITLSSSLNPSVLGGSVLFTATVSAQSGGGIPTGTVTFYNGTTAMATLSLTNNLSAQYSTTTLQVGSNSITAVYGGSATYSGSTSPPLNQIVQTATIATTTTLTSSLNPSVSGKSVVLGATVSPQSGTGVPTGTVTFYDGATVLAAPGISNGSAQYSTTTLPLGSNSITAVYGGSASYSGSTSAPFNQVVQTATVATTTTLTSSLNPSVSGKRVLLSATVSAQSGGGIPTGTVIFYDGMTALSTASLKNGVAQYNTTALPAGSNSITAVYGGSAAYSGSTSSPLSQAVQAVTTTTVTSSLGSSAFGQPVTFTASVSSSVGAPPNGDTVTFEHGAIVLGTGTLSGGVATLSTSTLAAGSYSITAVYDGDSNFKSSTSKAVKLVVAKASGTTSLVSSLNPSIFGQGVTLTATVAPQFSGTPTGTVTFKKGTVNLATVSLSGGMASYTTTKLAVGTNSLTAVYNGDTSFTHSTSTALSQVVNP